MTTSVRLRLIRELASYTTATGLAFAIDIGLLAILVSLLGVPYLPAAALGFLAGTAFVYWAATRHIFAFRRVDDPRVEFGVFLAIGAVGLAVNLAVIYAAVDMLELHYLAGKIGAGAVTFTINYGLRRLLLFTQWHDPDTGAGRSSG